MVSMEGSFRGLCAVIFISANAFLQILGQFWQIFKSIDKIRKFMIYANSLDILILEFNIIYL